MAFSARGVLPVTYSLSRYFDRVGSLRSHERCRGVTGAVATPAPGALAGVVRPESYSSSRRGRHPGQATAAPPGMAHPLQPEAVTRRDQPGAEAHSDSQTVLLGARSGGPHVGPGESVMSENPRTPTPPGRMKEALRPSAPQAGERLRGNGRGEEALLRRLIDQIADGIVIVDAAGDLRFANPAAEALFGRPADELIGEPFGFPLTAGEATEIDVLRGPGDTVVVELRAVEIEWERASALLVSLRDITDRRRAEEQARELAREQAARAEAEAAEHRNRLLAEEKAALAEENARLFRQAQDASIAKSEFLAVVSHELRTPLNAIIGYTDLLTAGLAGPLTPTQRQQLGRVKASSRHLLEVVDDILTFSRLEAGRETIHPGPVEYAQLLADVAALVQPLTDRKGLSLEIDAPKRPCHGEADERKVRQILLNLVSNATKFTDEGQIRLSARPDGDHIVFQVHDTGVGIPAAHLRQIWEPFWQVEQSHTRTAGGTGLGLSVVRRLTDLMGGTVDVESEPGTGTTFTVRLPLRLARPEPSC
jgi:signal transduction histidine kinase